MRKGLYLLSAFFIAGSAFYIAGCNNSSEEKPLVASETKPMSQDEMIKMGDYIVSTGACTDCHSPKVMTNMGPVVDSTKLLSGHPANEPLPPIDAKSLQPGNWINFAPDQTAAVGPWGISYSANLTPDSSTGIGAWTEEQFINTLRNGKHLGNGRPLLPPMPWDVFGKKTDEDLKAIFAYLKSLPAISNKVPPPVAPPDVMKMVSKK
jgi:hypothetical protein